VILTYPHDREALRSRAAIVDLSLPDVAAVAQVVLLRALELTGGLGLSAPQVGGGVRAFVVREWPDAFFNPEILKLGDEKEWAIESCLSLPGQRIYVERPTFVKLRSYRKNGEPRTTKHRGKDARVVLHELDHLDGVLISDYIPKAA
jgi:peptide deformylase